MIASTFDSEEEERQRHTVFYDPRCSHRFTPNYEPDQKPSHSDAVYSTFDRIAWVSSRAAERLAKAEHARQMRKRNLGYLYRPNLIPRLLFILRVPPVVFQPCWSARRWRSVT